MQKKESRIEHLINVLPNFEAKINESPPRWVEEASEDEFEVLIEICTMVLSSEQLLDLIDAELSFSQALGLLYSFLIVSTQSSPDEYLTKLEFFQ